MQIAGIQAFWHLESWRALAFLAIRCADQLRARLDLAQSGGDRGQRFCIQLTKRERP
jgi:hypothetical protein